MSCNFSVNSTEDAVALIQVAKTNLPELVINCPQICIAVFGAGNPDLGGIGVRPLSGTVPKIHSLKFFFT